MPRILFRDLSKKNTFLLVLVFILAGGCAALKPKLPAPETLRLPEPILDNSGRYFLPYTQDEVLAEWVDKAAQAKIGAFLGKTVCLLASTAVSTYTRRGTNKSKFSATHGVLQNHSAGKIGDKIGKELAIKAIGGWEYIRKTSDISFNRFDDMVLYLYIKYAKSDHYKESLDAASTIYPKLETDYNRIIRHARRK